VTPGFCSNIEIFSPTDSSRKDAKEQRRIIIKDHAEFMMISFAALLLCVLA